MTDIVNINITENPIFVDVSVTQEDENVEVLIEDSSVSTNIDITETINNVDINIEEDVYEVVINVTREIEEAPINDGLFGRKNASWEEIVLSDVSWGNILGTLSNQTDLWSVLGSKIETETDPVFLGSVAASISSLDVAYWNAKQESLTEGVNYLTPSAIALAYQPIGSYLTDSPLTGLTYGRNNGEWTEITSGSTNHSTLSNLDYANANHSGFEPTITILEANRGGTGIDNGDLIIDADLSTYNHAPDMGHEQKSDVRGYGVDYITDKLISNSRIGSNDNTDEGSIRTLSGVLQIYLGGTWNSIVSGFVLRESAEFGYTFEHQPIGFTVYIEVMSGNSVHNLGLNGLPIVQGYKVSMGAHPVPQVVNGGTF